MDLDKKRKQEKKVLSCMIDVYIKGHKDEKEICDQLREYAFTRIDKCPFMETKTFCSSCKVHCYKPDKRNQIKQVMRYSGPRMLMYHPILAIKHLMERRKNDR